MLQQVLDNLHNYFVASGGVHKGSFVVQSGNIQSDFLVDGQYFKVVGSILNDGVYRYPATGMASEEFTGEVWALAVPPAVVSLSEEISEWCNKYPATGFASESFGGYSYTKVTSSTSKPIGWEDVFRSRLNTWRKLS